MAMFAVQVDAAKTDRRLTSAAPAKRRAMPDPSLLFWRRMIDSAVADAKRTECGIPTDRAILQRWWIEEFKPTQQQRDEWELSFECCCGWLNLDAARERVRLLGMIDAASREAYDLHVRTVVYRRRAAVLTCAGITTAIARQYVLPLVSENEYEDVAGIDRDDPPAATRQVAPRRAT